MTGNITSIAPTTVADVRKEAEEEIRVGRLKTAKTVLVTKLREIEAAKTILSNLNRELDELEHELAAGL